MNAQGARLAAYGQLDVLTAAGTYYVPTRRLMMAYRKLKSMCSSGKDIHEIGQDGILLDKVMTELRCRGIKDLAKRGIN